MVSLWRTCIAITVTVMYSGLSFGGSILSCKGFGTPYQIPNSRSMGMGNLAIAQVNSNAIPRLNPAALFYIKTTKFSIQYFYENIKSKDQTDHTTSTYSNFDGFNFTIPLGLRTGFSLSLFPLTRMDYKLTYEDEVGGELYDKSVQGSGGLNAFSFSMYWAPTNNFSMGLSGKYLFSEIKENWRVNYQNDDFNNSSDVFITNSRGIGFTAGVIFQPIDPIVLGAIFTPATDLQSDIESYTPFTIINDFEESNAKTPQSWGAGISFLLDHHGMIGFEINQNDWSKMIINDQSVPGTIKTTRFSLGGEILPSIDPEASFFKRIAYRIGLSFEPYFLEDTNQNSISEKWFTLGFGLPLVSNSAYLDVSLGFGKRGTLSLNDIEENIFRMGISITGNEKWFIRRY